MSVILILFLIINFVLDIYSHKLCNIQLQGWGYDDPNCPSDCAVYIKLNDQIVYERRWSIHGVRTGFHLGFINIRSCTLLYEPQVCETFFRVEDNVCISDNIDAFPSDVEDVVTVVLSGNSQNILIIQQTTY